MRTMGRVEMRSSLHYRGAEASLKSAQLFRRSPIVLHMISPCTCLCELRLYAFMDDFNLD